MRHRRRRVPASPSSRPTPAGPGSGCRTRHFDHRPGSRTISPGTSKRKIEAGARSTSAAHANSHSQQECSSGRQLPEETKVHFLPWPLLATRSGPLRDPTWHDDVHRTGTATTTWKNEWHGPFNEERRTPCGVFGSDHSPRLHVPSSPPLLPPRRAARPRARLTRNQSCRQPLPMYTQCRKWKAILVNPHRRRSQHWMLRSNPLRSSFPRGRRKSKPPACGNIWTTSTRSARGKSCRL